jgi:hypothetical protein
MLDLLFSDEDADFRAMKWGLDRHGYARRTINRKPLPPVRAFAHHMVLERSCGRRPDWSIREVCDHINRNKLDNRRENLRIVSVTENARNKDYSGCKYYCKHKGGKFQAQYRHNGKGIYIGLFQTAYEARAATLAAMAKAALQPETL